MVHHTENIRPTLYRPSPVRRVDFDWLTHAAKLPGRTLQVACAIYFIASLHGTPTIRLAPYALRMFGVAAIAVTTACAGWRPPS